MSENYDKYPNEFFICYQQAQIIEKTGSRSAAKDLVLSRRSCHPEK